jgi:flavin-binding protein dodecin
MWNRHIVLSFVSASHKQFRRVRMTDHVYKTIHITGTSKDGIEQAIEGAVAKAAKTVHSLRWFKVKEVRGEVSADKVQYWQVSIEVGFTLD